MKTIVLTLLIVLIAVSHADADTYMKHKIHTDSYYYGGQVTPAEDRVIDVWIGNEKTAIVHEHVSLIFNLKEKTFAFINMDDSTYVESTLPVDLSILVSEEFFARLKMFPTTGTIEEIAEMRTIGGRECKGFKFHTWIPYEGVKYNESESMVWMTSDTPFDVEALTEITAQRLKLHNYGDDFIAKVSNIIGYPIMMETESVIKGFTVPSTDEVVEMTEKAPPDGVYSIPRGFAQKERLTRQDLQRQ